MDPQKSRTLKEWVNPLYLDRHRLASLARTYKSATPYPHIALTAFIKDIKAEELSKAISKLSFTRKQSDLFSLSQSGDLQASKNKTLQGLVKFLKSKPLREYLEELTGERIKTGLDVHAAKYEDTDYLLCHDDRLEKRKLAFILNLSRGFTQSSGGELGLLESDSKGQPTKVAKRIPPEWNTFTLFTVSERSHHVVDEVLEEKERMTIGGWFHG